MQRLFLLSFTLSSMLRGFPRQNLLPRSLEQVAFIHHECLQLTSPRNPGIHVVESPAHMHVYGEML